MWKKCTSSQGQTIECHLLVVSSLRLLGHAHSAYFCSNSVTVQLLHAGGKKNYWAKISAKKIYYDFPYLKLKPDVANTWISLQKENCSTLFCLWVFFSSGLPGTWHQGVKYDFIFLSWKRNGKTLKKYFCWLFFCKIENMVKIVKNKEYDEVYYADLFSLFHLTVIILDYAQ